MARVPPRAGPVWTGDRFWSSGGEDLVRLAKIRCRVERLPARDVAPRAAASWRPSTIYGVHQPNEAPLARGYNLTKDPRKNYRIIARFDGVWKQTRPTTRQFRPLFLARALISYGGSVVKPGRWVFAGRVGLLG